MWIILKIMFRRMNIVENIEEMNWISSLGSSLRLPNRFRKEIKYCKPIQVHNNVYVIFDILRNNFFKNFLFKINYLPYKQKKLSKIVSLPPYSSFPFLSYPSCIPQFILALSIIQYMHGRFGIKELSYCQIL